MGMHDDPDESIMTKAMQDAAKPSIARAGDQRAAMNLRQAGIDITKDMQAALQAMRSEKQAEAARKRHAKKASNTPWPKDKGTPCKNTGKMDKNKACAGMHKRPAMHRQPRARKHAHVSKRGGLRLVHARGGANPKRRRCYIMGVPHGEDKHTLVLEVTKVKCNKTGDDYWVMGQLMMAMLANGHFTKQTANDMFLGALNKP
jgi:hypothetical protein